MKPFTHFTTKHLRGLCIAGFITIGLSACNIIFTETILAKNRENLGRLSVGMTKTEVLAIMGDKAITPVGGPIVNSPYRVETLKDSNNNNLEVLFFYTDEKRDESKISDDELTPVVLRDGKVEGWGRTFLSDLAPSYRYRYPH